MAHANAAAVKDVAGRAGGEGLAYVHTPVGAPHTGIGCHHKLGVRVHVSDLSVVL